MILIELAPPDPAATALRAARAMRDGAATIDGLVADVQRLRRQRAILLVLLALAAYL